ncbi:MAG: hypothetical protein ACAH12_08365 [Methylophilaceae bacterium]
MAISLDLLKLSSFDLHCIEMLEGLPNSKAKHCFRSALHHLNAAQKIAEADLSMAVFRAITAEEEAATGLMLELKNKKYNNSEHLEVQNHIHKGAVIELMSIIIQFLEDNFPGSNYDLSIYKVDEQLMLKLQAEMNINKERITFIPEPPFSLSFRVDGKKFSMKQQIQTLLDKRGSQTIKAHLKQKANFRNLLLYASDKGYPKKPVIEENFFPVQLKKVLSMLRVFLMVTPYDELQPAVQDSIDLFYLIVKDIHHEDMHSEL